MKPFDNPGSVDQNAPLNSSDLGEGSPALGTLDPASDLPGPTEQNARAPEDLTAPDESHDDAARQQPGCAPAEPTDGAPDVFATVIDAVKNVKAFVSRQDDLNRTFLGFIQTARSPDPGGAGVEDLVQKVSEIASGQGELARLFESRIYSNDVQAKALERLHDELQSYKLQFMRQQMLPLLKDIIYCYDFAAGELERMKTSEEAGRPESLAQAIAHLKQMVQDVLFKYDVEPYRGETDEFDRKLQQCVQTVPTANQADDKKVAAVGHVGFKSASADTVIRKEQVTVYKYGPAT